jgi:transcriptional regulator with XRE-family HTH domain
MDANNFSSRLRRTRMTAGLHGKDLAKQAGISPPFLSQIEKGQRHPSDDVLMRLAHALKVSDHWLLTGEHPQAERPASKSDLLVREHKKAVRENPEASYIANDTEAALRARISDLEHDLAMARDTIHNLSAALAGHSIQPTVAPASGAEGGGAQSPNGDGPHNHTRRGA